MILNLKYYNDPILRKKSKKIEKLTDEIRTFIADMKETVLAHENSIGLSAPQVGRDLSIFIIKEAVLNPDGNLEVGEMKVFINPVLSRPSQEKESLLEGCMSFPGIHLEIERPISIHVKAMDEEGKPIDKTYSGFTARQIMHENDHLNGVLFIDRAKPNLRKKVQPLLQALKKKYTPQNL